MARRKDSGRRLARCRSDVGWRLARERLERAPPGLGAPDRDDGNRRHEQPDHEAQHALHAVILEQDDDEEGRDDGGAAAEEIADAVGAQAQLGREDLRRIDTVEGLVTIVPRLGAFVRTITIADVEEIYAVRA